MADDQSKVFRALAVSVGNFLSVVCPEQLTLRQRRKRSAKPATE